MSAHFFLFLKDVSVYLKGRFLVVEKGHRKIVHLLFHLPNDRKSQEWCRLKPGQRARSQKLPLRLPHGFRGPSTGSPSTVFPGTSVKSQIASRLNWCLLGFQHCRHQYNVQCCNTSANTFLLTFIMAKVIWKIPILEQNIHTNYCRNNLILTKINVA